MNTKVVINACYGGFSVSDNCARALRLTDNYQVSREDPRLIDYIERHGSAAASGPYSKLRVVEIPSDVRYTIEDYDGREHIAEVHRTWS